MAERRRAKTSPGKDGPGEQIRIDVHHCIALITPPPPLDLLRPVLQYTERTFVAGGGLGYQERVVEVPLANYDLRGPLAVPTGLVPRIVETLKRHGFRVRVDDHRRFGKRFEVDKAFLAKTSLDKLVMLDAVQREPLGRIEVPGFNAAVEAMGRICQMYPKASVLIPVNTRSMAKDVWWKLRELRDFPVRLKAQKPWSERRVMCQICTYLSLGTCNPQFWDIVLLPDSSSATQETATKALQGLLRAETRVYGLALPRQALGERSMLRLEAMLGQVIHHCDETQDEKVRVLRLTPPRCPALGKCPALEFKRQGYWTNDRRNDFIAAVARAFAKQDMEKLRKYGVPCDGGKPRIRYGESAKFAILVESLEHGLELQRRLPGWALWHADTGEGEERPQVAEVSGVPDGKIVTSASAAQEGLDVDVIIQASGGKNTVPVLKRRKQGYTQQEEIGLLLVDFDDRFDDRAAQDAVWRFGRYAKRDWLT